MNHSSLELEGSKGAPVVVELPDDDDEERGASGENYMRAKLPYGLLDVMFTDVRSAGRGPLRDQILTISV